MAVTTTEVLTNTIPTVLENARFTQRFAAIMTKLVWKIRKELHDGKNINIPVFGIVTVRNLTEGVDNTVDETMTDTLVTVTPGEVGAKIILTDKLVRDNQEDVKAAAGRLLGEAYALKEDQDLLGQFTSAGTTLGAGGAATMGQIAAGRATIRGNPEAKGGPWMGSLAFVQHPYVTLDMIDIITPLVPIAGSASAAAAWSGGAEDALTTGTIGRLFGMPVIEAGNIDITTIASTSKGGVFATGMGSAIIQAVAHDWEIEPERDASLRATELNIVGEYGVGIYEADWIVEMNHDATPPA